MDDDWFIDDFEAMQKDLRQALKEALKEETDDNNTDKEEAP